MKATNVTKENGIITIICDDSRKVIINCVNNTIKSYSGNVVNTFPTAVKFEDDLEKYSILRKLRYLQSDKGKKTLSNIETLWNVLEKVSVIPDELPKGYIKYCMENNYIINNDTLKSFMESQRLKSFNDKDRKVLIILHSILDINSYSTEDLHNIIKVFNNSVKDLNHFLNIKENMKKFLKYYNNENLHKLLNYEKSAYYNVKIIEAHLEEERQFNIAKQQNKIKDLENLSLNGLKIIVPTTLAQFTDEGNQQNNCVGYYYHDSIIKGRYLIYFIRKEENIEKSYITCRYDVNSHETIEHRTKNNNWYCDKERIFKTIDRTIKELLND